ncbi:MAG: type II toxin-antitoxin system RelE/ParE family toxin [Thermodesulfobacteriota bacterium]|nr:type II toxin-antitoxin system RelE/ParE family toxin [Thermodesulfobacteriota bacterium]
MTIYQSRIFKKRVKRFSKKEKEILDQEIKRIVGNPSIGQEKKGDLSGVYGYKFKVKTFQYLLAYRIFEDDVELIMLGSHENYYRDLKNYLKRT